MSDKEAILAKIEEKKKQEEDRLAKLRSDIQPFEKEILKKIEDAKKLESEIETLRSLLRETISKSVSVSPYSIPFDIKQKLSIVHKLPNSEKATIECLVGAIVSFASDDGIYKYVVVNPNTPYGPMQLLLELNIQDLSKSTIQFPYDNALKLAVEKVSF